jgi:predicted enzyme related to lactoylglutathione lyase
MAAPIVHIEFRSSDFGRTATFYSKIFDWQTQQNASSMYMKHDAENGPTAGWVRAEVSQAPGPMAFVAVDDLTAKLAEIEKAGGRTIVPSMPFAGGGEIGIFADPDGNVVGLWMRKDRPSGSSDTPVSTPGPAASATAKSTGAKPAASAVKATAPKTATEKKPKTAAPKKR